ncbi:MAG TPA: P22 phage major capsid protein family protein [Candidatus Limnocylindrales bacterium]|nr:P22 phage major capsid protein family protein [Candidatus Limnocylindrales bacterium]
MPVTNNFKKVDYVTMETLRLFMHSSEIFANMRHDHEEDFKKEFAVGDRIRVKFPWRPVIRDGFTYTPQNIERLETTIVVDQPFGIDFEWDTIDKLLNMERGEERVKKEYLRPAALYLAAEADKRAAAFAYKNTGNITGQLGTNPTTFDATSAAVRQRFVEMSSLSDDQGIYVPPAVMRAIKGGSDGNLARFGPVEDIKKLYRQGVVGKADGFEWTESMSLKSHTAGTWAGAVTLNGAVANGATSLAVTCTTGDTFKEGDVIGLGSVYRVNPVTRERTESANTMTVTVAADTVGVISAATVQIKETLYFSGNYQNIDAQPANGATLTLFPGTTSPNGKSGKQGLAFTRDAFAGISLPLPMPKNEELVSQTTDPDTGISIAFIRSFDAVNRKWVNRFDVLLGFGRLHCELAAMRILCA